MRFTIDKAESELTNTLTIQTSIPFTLDSLRQISPHQELLRLLHNQEATYQSKQKKRMFIGSNTALNTFHVSCLSTTRALELLANTNALYLDKTQLVCNLLSDTEFYYHIETCEKNLPKISGRLKEKEREIGLKDCSFLCSGANHYYITGISLKAMATEVAWKDLKRLYLAPQEVSLQQIQKEYGSEDDPLQPKIVYTDAAEKLPSEKPPLPRLILTDRLGAFANLWIDYSLENSDEIFSIPAHEPTGWIKNRKGRPFIKRRLDTEKDWEKDLLETDYIKKIDGNAHYYCPVDCITKSLSFLLDIGWHLQDSQGRRICRPNETRIQIETIENDFIVKGSINYEDHKINITDVVGAFNRKDNFIQISANLVGFLPDGIGGNSLNGLSEEGEIVNEGIKIRKNRFGVLSELMNSDLEVTTDDTFKDLDKKLINFDGIELAPPSDKFHGTLRPYQQTGIDWLAFLYDYGFHGLLADDMGLGKTVQVLAFLSRITSTLPTLIVLPTSLIFNWKREIHHFLPEAFVHIHQGVQRKELKGDELPANTIILTSYATLRTDIASFQQIAYECVILDEAQTIKNANTITAQAVYRLKARFRLSLTGTPIENHITELWAHFRFLIPDLFGAEKTFLADVTASSSDFRYLEKIRQKMRPFLLRRKKEEVAKDLPEKIEQVVWVEMNPEQRKVYNDFLASFKSNLLKKVDMEGLSKHRIEVLEALLRLRQICCHPLLALSQNEEVQNVSSSKLDMLIEDLATAIDEGRKVLVYSQFTSMLKLIVKEVQKRSWNFVYLDGQTKDREEVVRAFQEKKEVSLFLISLKAGGIGLNLTAADYVFLYDPWWNEAVENQAIDRAHRIGRKDTVIAKRYVAYETVEEKMMNLKAAKRSLLTDILNGQIPPSQLTVEDLHYLIQ